MIAAIMVQKALYDALAGSSELTALCGADAIYDDLPVGTKPPYIVFEKIESFDWSTATEEGEEHEITLGVWSSGRGRKRLSQIISAISAALTDLNGIGGDFHLVNFSREQVTTQRILKSGLYKAEIIYRAVTEPI